MRRNEYQAAAEMLEVLDGEIRPKGGRVSMTLGEADAARGRSMVFLYESARIKGERISRAEIVPFFVLAYLRDPASLARTIAARWIGETRKQVADGDATKGNATDEN